MSMHRKVKTKLVWNKDGKRVRVEPDQGLKRWFVKCSKVGRESFDVGTIFEMDLKDPKRGNFYVAIYQNLFTVAAEHTTTWTTSVVDPDTPIIPPPIQRMSKDVKIPDYLIIKRDLWDLAVTAIKLNRYPLFLGPKGTGKSLSAKALAEALGMTFKRFNLGSAFKPKKFFVGGLQASATGETYFVPSEFYSAFTSDKPTLILLDEITCVPSQSSNFLKTVLDKDMPYIYNEDKGETVYRGEHVRIVSAGNIGLQYTDTRSLDGALSDRFIKISLDYLEQEEEENYLMEKFDLVSRENIHQLVRVANVLRKAEKNNSLSQGISLRQLEAAIEYKLAGFTISEIIEKVILTNFVSSDEYEQAKALIQTA